MSTLGQLKASSEKIVSAGRDKVLAIRQDRRQHVLFAQLGLACYHERSGKRGVDAQIDIDEIIAELSLMDRSGTLDEAVDDESRAVEPV